MKVEFVVNLGSFRACEKTKLINSWWYDSPCILVDSLKYWLPKSKQIWKKAESQSMTIKYASGGIEGKPIFTRTIGWNESLIYSYLLFLQERSYSLFCFWFQMVLYKYGEMFGCINTYLQGSASIILPIQVEFLAQGSLL